MFKNRGRNSTDGRCLVVVLGATPRGGHPEYIFKLLTGMQSTMSSFDVYWPIRPDFDERFKSDLITFVAALPVMNDRHGSSRGRWLLTRINPLKRHDFGFIRFLLQSPRPDVVLVEEVQRFTLPLVALVTRAVGAKLVVQLHNVRRHDYQGGLVDRLDEWTVALALKMADLVLVHTEGNRQSVAANLTSEANVRILAHGIEPVVSEVLAPPDLETLLFFGVVRANKGLGVLYEAMKTMPEQYSLIIAGGVDPAFAETAAVLESDRDAAITWMTGFIEEADVSTLFRQVSAVVLPYTSFDAQSGVLHLAIEYGVPVVASALGGIAELVSDLDIGILVKPNDPALLAAAMIEILVPEVNVRYRENMIKAHRGRTWHDAGLRLGELLMHVVEDRE